MEDCWPRPDSFHPRGAAHWQLLHESYNSDPAIITGSKSLPEVKRAMEEASRHYVHLAELMLAVGPRFAELTRADWGIATAGCAAAITHATPA